MKTSKVLITVKKHTPYLESASGKYEGVGVFLIVSEPGSRKVEYAGNDSEFKYPSQSQKGSAQ